MTEKEIKRFKGYYKIYNAPRSSGAYSYSGTYVLEKNIKELKEMVELLNNKIELLEKKIDRLTNTDK